MLSLFFRCSPAIGPYLKSTNLLERFIRELRRGMKVRDHQFPNPEVLEKLVYLECERKEKWAKSLRGLGEAQEELRYPQPQTTTQNS